MKPADAACVTAMAVLLAAAVAAASAKSATAPAPALTLHRMVPLSAPSLEQLLELDRARLARRRGVPEFGLLAMPGIYYTLVTLGNPPKQYSLQFDTGSNLMWLRCSPCTDCPLSGQPDGYAGESTTEGYYVSDIMRFDTVMGNKNEQATVSSAPVIFGCSNSLSGQVPTDGFMGFGKDAPSVILQLSSQGVSPKAFSHCLTSSDDGGGILVLGEVVEPGLVFTPLVPSQPRYSLNMKSIAVNGKMVHINSSLFTTSDRQGTFVDPGASSFYLVDEVYDQLIKAINHSVPQSVQSYVTNTGTLCYKVCSSNVSLLPVVTLYFEGGAPMTVGPKSYLVLEGCFDDHEIWCIAFQRSIEGYEHTIVLGDLVLRDKLFVYDLDKMRLGWVDYNCSLLNKTTLVGTASGSMRRHGPSYFGRLIAIGVAFLNTNIIALMRRLDKLLGSTTGSTDNRVVMCREDQCGLNLQRHLI